MKPKCGACSKIIAASDKLDCGSCELCYHYLCLNITTDAFKKMSKASRKLDKCPSCKLSVPKTDNSLTPVRGFASSPSVETDCQDEQTDMALPDIPGSELEFKLNNAIQRCNETLKNEIINILRTEIASIRNEMITGFSEIESKTNKIPELEKDFRSFQQRMIELETQFNTNQQWLRMNNVEIIGVPELKNESVTDIVIRIAKHAGVSLLCEDVEFAHRVQSMQPSSGRSKNIVAKLKRRSLKDEIISGLRKQRGITTKDIGVPGESRQIFVKDHLNPSNKKLLSECRSICKKYNYKYIWVKNCNIYVRKDDNLNFLRINSFSDLQKIT